SRFAVIGNVPQTGEPGRCREKSRGPALLLDLDHTQTLQLIAVPAATAAAIMTASTPAAAGAFLARAGDVDRDRAAIQLTAVEGADGFLRFLGGAHGDKGKTTRAAAHFVRHQVGFNDAAVRGKRVLKIVLRGIEGKISYE